MASVATEKQMESSSSSHRSSSLPLYGRRTLKSSPTNRSSNSLFDRIGAAIHRKSCPICLKLIKQRRAAVLKVCMHAYCIDCIRKWSCLKQRCPLCNADFHSCFFRINLSSRTFYEEKLRAPEINPEKNSTLGSLHRRRLRDRLAEQRLIRRSREEFNSTSLRTRPLPIQRSFGQSRYENMNVITERVLNWRASIYEQLLQAVPFSSKSCYEQITVSKDGYGERMRQRIEPWIQRELQAILGDPDPSVIVHMASSLLIKNLEESHKASIGSKDEYIEPLRPFLLERTSMFWHELRCFAESPFTMETYDTVVEYRFPQVQLQID